MEIHGLSLSGDRAKEFERLMRQFAESESATIAPDVAIQRIRDHFADYAKKHIFKPGDIVRFKPGLGTIAEKLDGKPCVVMEVLNYPIIGDSQGSAPEYGARLDMRIGALTQSGQFGIALFESALFEPWPNERV